MSRRDSLVSCAPWPDALNTRSRIAVEPEVETSPGAQVEKPEEIINRYFEGGKGIDRSDD